MAPTVTIHARGLTKRYGERLAVDRLDLDVHEGEVFGLLGPNGAGKTTTILMLLGLSEPEAGEIEVLGLDPRRHPLEVKRRVGYLPDAVGFYENMTGRENLRFTARLNGLDPLDAEDRIDATLDQVGLVEGADLTVEAYSRGMRQRLGVADALIKDPSVLILDEPTTAIDPEGVAEMLGLVRRLAEEEGVSILLSSHLLHQVQTVCDRVAIFVRGRIVATGTTRELAASGKGPETLEIGCDAGHERVEEVLGRIGAVRRAEPSPRDPGVWNVRVARGSTPQVLAALVESGIGVWHLRRSSEELDEIYRRYFEEVRADA